MKDTDDIQLPEGTDVPEGEKSEEQLFNEIMAEQSGGEDPDRVRVVSEEEDEPDGDDTSEAPDQDDEGPAAADGERAQDDDNEDGGPEPEKEPKPKPQPQNDFEERYRKERRTKRRLERTVSRLSRKLKQYEENAEARQQAAEERAARKEKIEAAAEEYGDIIAPVAEGMADQDRRLEQLAQEEESEIEDARQELNDLVAEAQATLAERHPDYQEVISKNLDTLNRWVDDQPAWIREIHAANKEQFVDGEGAAILLDRFKKAMAAADGSSEPRPQRPKPKPSLSKRRQRQLDGARSTRNTGPKRVASGTPGESATEEDWYNHFRNN